MVQPWIVLVRLQINCKCPGSSSRTVMDLIQLFDIKEIYSWITRRILLNFGRKKGLRIFVSPENVPKPTRGDKRLVSYHSSSNTLVSR